jgi:hypothetical protein
MPRQSLAPKVVAGTALVGSRARASTRVLFVALALLAQAMPASAQNNGLPQGSYPSYPPQNVRVFISPDKDQQDRRGVMYINKQQCPSDPKQAKNGALIEIDIANLVRATAQVNVLEVWRGQSSTDSNTSFTRSATGGQNCFKGDARRNTSATGSGGSVTQCTKMKFSPNSASEPPVDVINSVNTTNQKIFIRAVDAFTSSGSSSNCDLSAGWSLYVVPLSQPTPTTPGAQPSDGVLAYPSSSEVLEIKFYIDTTPLDPPGSVSGGSGNTQVKISWKTPSGANLQTKYDIIYDESAREPAGDSCKSTLLVSGKDIPSDPDIKSKSAGSTTSLTIDPAELGLSTNEQVPAVVVSKDAAGNLSKASNVVCVERVNTKGFWGACEQEDGCAEGFDGCSISLLGRNHAWGWSLSLVGLALWLRRSRRAGPRASKLGRTV